MPATEEKVNTTLREVIGESVAQTQKKSDDKSSQQTQSGEKREFIAGIDVSDIPDNMTKSEFKELFGKKAKLLDDGYVPKFKEVAEFKKERDAIVSLGVSPQEAARIIREAVENKKNETKGEVKKEIRRELKALEDEAPDMETRRGVERLGKVILQEVDESPTVKELRERLDKAEKALGYVQNKTVQSRVDSLTEALDDLKGKKFDPDFIEKHREKVIENGKLYLDASVHKILQVIADPEEYDEALLKTKKKEESKERNIKEKLNANDSASSGVTGSDKQFDVKSNTWKNTLRHVFANQKR